MIEVPPSTIAPPEPWARNLAELLFARRPGERGDGAILMGCLSDRAIDVSLDGLRRAAVALAEWLARRGIRPGDTVCLARLPRTSETLCAVAYVALSAFGIRVLLPMYLDFEAFAGWLERSGSRAVLWAAHELHEIVGTEGDRAALARLAEAVAGLGIPAYCLHEDLHLSELLLDGATAGQEDARHRAASWIGATDAATECLILTTSGTSGRSKLVRYRQGAFLRSCAAWQAAGLLEEDRLGGRGLCLLLAHSMGVRALWNALFTRQPLCLITPEWFAEHPERVRALLLSMRPRHVVGGPAVFRTLLELLRVFPEIKESCLRELHCALSVGAPYDPDLARRLEATLGLRLENGFGTTETMLVATTLLGGSDLPRHTLGLPLPGVRLSLAEHPDHAPPVYRLHVASPFGCAGYLGEAPHEVEPGGFATGDLVEATPHGLCHRGRETDDFVKDGFGVKVARARLLEWYCDMGEPILHIECVPLREEPGLAALVFVSAPAAGETVIDDRRVLSRVRAQLEARHEALRTEIEELELRHLTVARFACVAGGPPLTSKGTIARAALRDRHGSLLGRLVERGSHGPGIVSLEREKVSSEAWVRLGSPRRGELMRLARLDKHYRAGRGDRLIHRERGREIEVVDFVGGFGGNLLGHRAPAVIAAAKSFLDSEQVALWDQGSARPQQGLLARRLALFVGRHTRRSYVVRLASTGAEAVEMALAHAFLERDEWLRRLFRDQKRRFGGSHPELAGMLEKARAALRESVPKVLAIAGGFHGHSLGSRSVSSKSKRTLFAPMMRIEPVFLPADGVNVDVDGIVARESIELSVLERSGRGAVPAMARFCGIVAAIAEPILGEGGIREVDTDLLRRLGAYDFPLIIDEIQCGLGRTGEPLASAGVAGHTYLFAKALGGGVAKIAAVCIDRERYVPRFDELYSSTFAGDPFSCAVALEVLREIERNDVPARCRSRGAALHAALDEVRLHFPDVIRAVRGRGLMQGVELDPDCAESSFILRGLVRHEMLGLLAASYMLNRHRVRLLPTLSAPLTLRVEPSAGVDDEAIARLSQGLSAFASAVKERRLDELLSCLVEEEHGMAGPELPEEPTPRFDPRIEPPPPTAFRVAFLNHFVLPERELATAEPSLARLSPTERRALFHRMAALLDMKPLLAFARTLLRGRIWFCSIIVPADAATLEELHRKGYRYLETERLQEAVDLAAALGCRVVALGGYTSILTHDGTALLPPPSVRISSGNSFTVAAGLRRILSACREAGIDPARAGSRLAIVGATGNIGRSLARHASRSFRRLLLVGRSSHRLAALRDELCAVGPSVGAPPDIELSRDLAAVAGCNVIAVATSGSEPLIYPPHVGHGGPVLVADLAVPSAVSPQVRALPHVRVIPLAGTVAIPGEPDFQMSSHTAPGTAFCCAAEAMLLGLEPEATAGLRLTGEIDAASVARLDELGERHRFFDALGEGGFRAGG